MVLVIMGVLFYALSITNPFRLVAPRQIGILNLIFTGASIAPLFTALFFLLRALFLSKVKRLLFAGLAFVTAILLLVQFLSSYYEYLTINRMLDRVTGYQMIVGARFPDFVEKLARAKNTHDQELIARMAYQIYGVRMSYRPDGAEAPIYYSPPANLDGLREETGKMNSAINNLRTVSKGLLYRTADVVLAAFITFVVCLLGIAIRPPRDELSPFREPSIS